MTNTKKVINLLTELSKKYGGIVYDKRGKVWDWGQALCREIYGYDWMHSEQFQEDDKLPDVPLILVTVAENILKKGLPKWVKKNKEMLK